ncbi:Ig-like domain-containing protein [Nonomuraea sp. MCN248]|uniref:Ig-like domain-containing protein n=1 Tax=Nonomuraea corallina TaxID=2989783 RepID=A0ABT4SNX4_9ACTN|nr:LamG-like jellyroll fold domain-containing protein [Nonomuraea corallina]MDA0638794.1 Ig-like domain-containing protein [Nonomuraea corallina]
MAPWTMDTLTWSNQPSVTVNGQVGNKGAYSATIPCPEGEGELYYSIEQMVQAWMDGEPDEGVQLSSASETVAQNWRSYRSDEYGGYDTYPFTPRGPVLFIEYEPAPVETVEVGTFQYGHWGATPADLAAQQARQTEVEIPPFTNPTDEEAGQAALNSPIRSQVDANELEPPPGLTEEELEEFGESEGGGYDDVPDESDPAPDTVAPQVLTNPADGDTNIPTDTEIRVAFGESVTGQTFVLKDSAATDVSFSATPIGDDPDTEEIEPSDQGWILKPEHSLKGAERYRIEVRAARDAAGNVMTDYAATFTTAGGATPVAGLVAAYGMNEGSGTGVADSSGSNNAGLATAASWQNGKYGKALSFNGSSSWVTVQDAASLRLTTGMTLSAWVNPASVADWSSVVSKELSAGGVSYLLYAANGDSVPSGWAKVSAEGHATANGVSPLPVNTWSHLALTYDGAALRLFVNGQQVADTPLTESLIDDGSPLRIGGNGIWGEYFSGLIDEVRIYNRAQTAAEIQTDMTTPIGGTAPPDTQAPTAPGSLAATGAPGNAQLTWTASTDNVGVDGYRIHRSTTPAFTPSAANQVGSSPTTTFTDAGLAAGMYYYRVRAVDAAGNLGPSSNEVSATVTAPPTTPGLVAAYGMDEGTGTTVGDSSGQNNTGAATDTTWTATGKHGKALSFNGSSSWITVPHAESLRLKNALTFSAWVQPAAVDGWRTVLMKENADGPAYGLYASVGDVPLGWLENATTSKTVVGDDPLPLNQWSHLAVTYDGTIVTLYLNGTQVDQTPMTGDLADDGGVLRLGGNNVWEDEFFSGAIDEVRIYNRVQTAAEIQTDMNTPIGAAPAGVAAQQRRMDATADASPTINKLTIEGARTVDGITVASTLTPHLTTWLTTGRNGEAKVGVEIAGKLTKSFKAGKVITDRRLIWSGQATAKPNDSQVTLQVPKGLLRDGEKVRWRARAGDRGAWSPWAGLAVDLEQGATGDKTSNDPRGTAPSPAAAIADDDSRVQECWRHEQQARTGATDGTDGYYMNRNTWCAIQEVARGDAQIGSRPGIFVNGITADATIIGTAGGNGEGTPTKDRFSRYRISLKNVTAIGGVYNRQAMIGFGASTYNTACKIAGDSYVQGPWQQWRDGKAVEFTVVSDEANGRGIDKIERCFPKFYAKIWLDGIPSTPPKTYWSDAKPEARCDSALYLTSHYGSGCIFDKVAAVYKTTETRPGLPWSDMGDPDNVNMAYRSVASHIWTAQHKKDLTLPKRIDKSIPGHWLSASGSLSRNVNRDWKRKNNTKSRNMCRLLFKDYDRRDAELGKGEKHKVYECDEFPFQSTMQGTWVSVERVNSPDAYAYSIRPVWWKRNTEDGIRLGAFYGSQRILGEDGTRRKTTYDHFWVEAYVPGQNPH